METVEYSPGRLVDLYGDPAQPTILIQHGMQIDARSSVRPLADLVAHRGRAVVVPDWNSGAGDCGCSDLLQSLSFAQQRTAAAEGLVLVCWSPGGGSDHPRASIRRPARVHRVSGRGFMAPDPISGGDPAAELASTGGRSAFTLLHGSADDLVSISAGRTFASVLDRNGWPVELVELDADHASIAGVT